MYVQHYDIADAIADLARMDFFRKGLGPVHHRRMREDVLTRSVAILGSKHGVELEQTDCIDSRGEIRIFVKEGASFGEKFSAMLNGHNPRTGTQPGAHLLPESTWCYMNHLDVERMVREAAGKKA